MYFHNRLYFLFAVLFSVSCTSSELKNDEKILIGTWSSNYITADGFNLSVVTFTSDGIKCTLSTSYDIKSGYDRGLYISKWKLHQNRIDVKIVKTSTPLLIVGETISDEVVTLTESEFIIRLLPIDPENEISDTEIYHKLSSTPDLSVCETANKLLR